MLKKIILILLATILSTACNEPAPAPKTDIISFRKLQPFKIDVSNIEVIEAYKSPFTAPNIEHLMAYTPADAMQLWTKDRLIASGNQPDTLMQINILDASVIETDLPKTDGLKGLFTNDQDKKYDAKLEVTLRIYAGGAMSEAETSINVTRSYTISEKASVNERKAAYAKMMAELMKMANDKLEQNIRSYMGKYIIY